ILKIYSSSKGQSKVTMDEFIAAYNANEPLAIRMVDDFVKYISVGINNILNIFNPDVIVINSGFTIYIPELHSRIKEQIKNRMNNYCTLVPSGLQDISILLGGACLVIKHFLGVTYLAPNSDFIVG
nr:ROK family protein [Lachnospiraceae bacterium]